jgi:hypothetical protein
MGKPTDPDSSVNTNRQSPRHEDRSKQLSRRAKMPYVVTNGFCINDCSSLVIRSWYGTEIHFSGHRLRAMLLVSFFAECRKTNGVRSKFEQEVDVRGVERYIEAQLVSLVRNVQKTRKH